MSRFVKEKIFKELSSILNPFLRLPITSENIVFGWTHVLIQNITIRDDIISDYGLPFKIIFSDIDRIKIRINPLSNALFKFEVDSVSLLLSPMDQCDWDDSKILNKLDNFRSNYLNRITSDLHLKQQVNSKLEPKLFFSPKIEEGPQPLTSHILPLPPLQLEDVIRRMINKILTGFCFSINNVHIRLEVPSKSLNMKTFTVSNEEGRQVKVKSDSTYLHSPYNSFACGLILNTSFNQKNKIDISNSGSELLIDPCIYWESNNPILLSQMDCSHDEILKVLRQSALTFLKPRGTTVSSASVEPKNKHEGYRLKNRNKKLTQNSNPLWKRFLDILTPSSSKGQNSKGYSEDAIETDDSVSNVSSDDSETYLSGDEEYQDGIFDFEDADGRYVNQAMTDACSSTSPFLVPNESDCLWIITPPCTTSSSAVSLTINSKVEMKDDSQQQQQQQNHSGVDFKISLSSETFSNVQISSCMLRDGQVISSLINSRKAFEQFVENRRVFAHLRLGIDPSTREVVPIECLPQGSVRARARWSFAVAAIRSHIMLSNLKSNFRRGGIPFICSLLRLRKVYISALHNLFQGVQFDSATLKIEQLETIAGIPLELLALWRREAIGDLGLSTLVTPGGGEDFSAISTRSVSPILAEENPYYNLNHGVKILSVEERLRNEKQTEGKNFLRRIIHFLKGETFVNSGDLTATSADINNNNTQHSNLFNDFDGLNSSTAAQQKKMELSTSPFSFFKSKIQILTSSSTSTVPTNKIEHKTNYNPQYDSSNASLLLRVCNFSLSAPLVSIKMLLPSRISSNPTSSSFEAHNVNKNLFFEAKSNTNLAVPSPYRRPSLRSAVLYMGSSSDHHSKQSPTITSNLTNLFTCKGGFPVFSISGTSLDAKVKIRTSDIHVESNFSIQSLWFGSIPASPDLESVSNSFASASDNEMSTIRNILHEKSIHTIGDVINVNDTHGNLNLRRYNNRISSKLNHSNDFEHLVLPIESHHGLLFCGKTAIITKNSIDDTQPTDGESYDSKFVTVNISFSSKSVPTLSIDATVKDICIHPSKFAIRSLIDFASSINAFGDPNTFLSIQHQPSLFNILPNPNFASFPSTVREFPPKYPKITQSIKVSITNINTILASVHSLPCLHIKISTVAIKISSDAWEERPYNTNPIIANISKVGIVTWSQLSLAQAFLLDECFPLDLAPQMTLLHLHSLSANVQPISNVNCSPEKNISDQTHPYVNAKIFVSSTHSPICINISPVLISSLLHSIKSLSDPLDEWHLHSGYLIDSGLATVVLPDQNISSSFPHAADAIQPLVSPFYYQIRKTKRDQTSFSHSNLFKAAANAPANWDKEVTLLRCWSHPSLVRFGLQSCEMNWEVISVERVLFNKSSSEYSDLLRVVCSPHTSSMLKRDEIHTRQDGTSTNGHLDSRIIYIRFFSICDNMPPFIEDDRAQNITSFERMNGFTLTSASMQTDCFPTTFANGDLVTNTVNSLSVDSKQKLFTSINSPQGYVPDNYHTLHNPALSEIMTLSNNEAPVFNNLLPETMSHSLNTTGISNKDKNVVSSQLFNPTVLNLPNSPRILVASVSHAEKLFSRLLCFSPALPPDILPRCNGWHMSLALSASISHGINISIFDTTCFSPPSSQRPVFSVSLGGISVSFVSSVLEGFAVNACIKKLLVEDCRLDTKDPRRSIVSAGHEHTALKGSFLAVSINLDTMAGAISFSSPISMKISPIALHAAIIVSNGFLHEMESNFPLNPFAVVQAIPPSLMVAQPVRCVPFSSAKSAQRCRNSNGGLSISVHSVQVFLMHAIQPTWSKHELDETNTYESFTASELNTKNALFMEFHLDDIHLVLRPLLKRVFGQFLSDNTHTNMDDEFTDSIVDGEEFEVSQSIQFGINSLSLSCCSYTQCKTRIEISNLNGIDNVDDDTKQIHKAIKTFGSTVVPPLIAIGFTPLISNKNNATGMTPSLIQKDAHAAYENNIIESNIVSAVDVKLKTGRFGLEIPFHLIPHLQTFFLDIKNALSYKQTRSKSHDEISVSDNEHGKVDKDKNTEIHVSNIPISKLSSALNSSTFVRSTTADGSIPTLQFASQLLYTPFLPAVHQTPVIFRLSGKIFFPDILISSIDLFDSDNNTMKDIELESSTPISEMSIIGGAVAFRTSLQVQTTSSCLNGGNDLSLNGNHNISTFLELSAKTSFDIITPEVTITYSAKAKQMRSPRFGDITIDKHQHPFVVRGPLTIVPSCQKSDFLTVIQAIQLGKQSEQSSAWGDVSVMDQVLRGSCEILNQTLSIDAHLPSLSMSVPINPLILMSIHLYNSSIRPFLNQSKNEFYNKGEDRNVFVRKIKFIPASIIPLASNEAPISPPTKEENAEKEKDFNIVALSPILPITCSSRYTSFSITVVVPSISIQFDSLDELHLLEGEESNDTSFLKTFCSFSLTSINMALTIPLSPLEPPVTGMLTVGSLTGIEMLSSPLGLPNPIFSPPLAAAAAVKKDTLNKECDGDFLFSLSSFPTFCKDENDDESSNNPCVYSPALSHSRKTLINFIPPHITVSMDAFLSFIIKTIMSPVILEIMNQSYIGNIKEQKENLYHREAAENTWDKRALALGEMRYGELHHLRARQVLSQLVKSFKHLDSSFSQDDKISIFESLPPQDTKSENTLSGYIDNFRRAIFNSNPPGVIPYLHIVSHTVKISIQKAPTVCFTSSSTVHASSQSISTATISSTHSISSSNDEFMVLSFRHCSLAIVCPSETSEEMLSSFKFQSPLSPGLSSVASLNWKQRWKSSAVYPILYPHKTQFLSTCVSGGRAKAPNYRPKLSFSTADLSNISTHRSNRKKGFNVFLQGVINLPSPLISLSIQTREPLTGTNSCAESDPWLTVNPSSIRVLSRPPLPPEVLCQLYPELALDFPDFNNAEVDGDAVLKYVHLDALFGGVSVSIQSSVFISMAATLLEVSTIFAQRFSMLRNAPTIVNDSSFNSKQLSVSSQDNEHQKSKSVLKIPKHVHPNNIQYNDTHPDVHSIFGSSHFLPPSWIDSILGRFTTDVHPSQQNKVETQKPKSARSNHWMRLNASIVFGSSQISVFHDTRTSPAYKFGSPSSPFVTMSVPQVVLFARHKKHHISSDINKSLEEELLINIEGVVASCSHPAQFVPLAMNSEPILEPTSISLSIRLMHQMNPKSKSSLSSVVNLTVFPTICTTRAVELNLTTTQLVEGLRIICNLRNEWQNTYSHRLLRVNRILDSIQSRESGKYYNSSSNVSSFASSNSSVIPSIFYPMIDKRKNINLHKKNMGTTKLSNLFQPPLMHSSPSSNTIRAYNMHCNSNKASPARSIQFSDRLRNKSYFCHTRSGIELWKILREHVKQWSSIGLAFNSSPGSVSCVLSKFRNQTRSYGALVANSSPFKMIILLKIQNVADRIECGYTYRAGLIPANSTAGIPVYLLSPTMHAEASNFNSDQQNTLHLPLYDQHRIIETSVGFLNPSFKLPSLFDENLLRSIMMTSCDKSLANDATIKTNSSSTCASPFSLVTPLLSPPTTVPLLAHFVPLKGFRSHIQTPISCSNAGVLLSIRDEDSATAFQTNPMSWRAWTDIELLNQSSSSRPPFLHPIPSSSSIRVLRVAVSVSVVNLSNCDISMQSNCALNEIQQQVNNNIQLMKQGGSWSLALPPPLSPSNPLLSAISRGISSKVTVEEQEKQEKGNTVSVSFSVGNSDLSIQPSAQLIIDRASGHFTVKNACDKEAANTCDSFLVNNGTKTPSSVSFISLKSNENSLNLAATISFASIQISSSHYFQIAQITLKESISIVNYTPLPIALIIPVKNHNNEMLTSVTKTDDWLDNIISLNPGITQPLPVTSNSAPSRDGVVSIPPAFLSVKNLPTISLPPLLMVDSPYLLDITDEKTNSSLHLSVSLVAGESSIPFSPDPDSTLNAYINQNDNNKSRLIDGAETEKKEDRPIKNSQFFVKIELASILSLHEDLSEQFTPCTTTVSKNSKSFSTISNLMAISEGVFSCPSNRSISLVPKTISKWEYKDLNEEIQVNPFELLKSLSQENSTTEHDAERKDSALTSSKNFILNKSSVMFISSDSKDLSLFVSPSSTKINKVDDFKFHVQIYPRFRITNTTGIPLNLHLLEDKQMSTLPALSTNTLHFGLIQRIRQLQLLKNDLINKEMEYKEKERSFSLTSKCCAPISPTPNNVLGNRSGVKIPPPPSVVSKSPNPNYEVASRQLSPHQRPLNIVPFKPALTTRTHSHALDHLPKSLSPQLVQNNQIESDSFYSIPCEVIPYVRFSLQSEHPLVIASILDSQEGGGSSNPASSLIDEIEFEEQTNQLSPSQLNNKHIMMKQQSLFESIYHAGDSQAPSLSPSPPRITSVRNHRVSFLEAPSRQKSESPGTPKRPANWGRAQRLASSLLPSSTSIKKNFAASPLPVSLSPQQSTFLPKFPVSVSPVSHRVDSIPTPPIVLPSSLSSSAILSAPLLIRRPCERLTSSSSLLLVSSLLLQIETTPSGQTIITVSSNPTPPLTLESLVPPPYLCEPSLLVTYDPLSPPLESTETLPHLTSPLGLRPGTPMSPSALVCLSLRLQASRLCRFPRPPSVWEIRLSPGSACPLVYPLSLACCPSSPLLVVNGKQLIPPLLPLESTSFEVAPPSDHGSRHIHAHVRPMGSSLAITLLPERIPISTLIKDIHKNKLSAKDDEDAIVSFSASIPAIRHTFTSLAQEEFQTIIHQTKLNIVINRSVNFETLLHAAFEIEDLVVAHSTSLPPKQKHMKNIISSSSSPKTHFFNFQISLPLVSPLLLKEDSTNGSEELRFDVGLNSKTRIPISINSFTRRQLHILTSSPPQRVLLINSLSVSLAPIHLNLHIPALLSCMIPIAKLLNAIWKSSSAYDISHLGYHTKNLRNIMSPFFLPLKMSTLNTGLELPPPPVFLPSPSLWARTLRRPILMQRVETPMLSVSVSVCLQDFVQVLVHGLKSPVGCAVYLDSNHSSLQQQLANASSSNSQVANDVNDQLHLNSPLTAISPSLGTIWASSIANFPLSLFAEVDKTQLLHVPSFACMPMFVMDILDALRAILGRVLPHIIKSISRLTENTLPLPLFAVANWKLSSLLSKLLSNNDSIPDLYSQLIKSPNFSLLTSKISSDTLKILQTSLSATKRKTRNFLQLESKEINDQDIHTRNQPPQTVNTAASCKTNSSLPCVDIINRSTSSTQQNAQDIPLERLLCMPSRPLFFESRLTRPFNVSHAIAMEVLAESLSKSSIFTSSTGVTSSKLNVTSLGRHIELPTGPVIAICTSVGDKQLTSSVQKVQTKDSFLWNEFIPEEALLLTKTHLSKIKFEAPTFSNSLDLKNIKIVSCLMIEIPLIIDVSLQRKQEWINPNQIQLNSECAGNLVSKFTLSLKYLSPSVQPTTATFTEGLSSLFQPQSSSSLIKRMEDKFCEFVVTCGSDSHHQIQEEVTEFAWILSGVISSHRH